MSRPEALQGCKILLTGPAGQIAFPLAEALARDNEVWGIARFSEAGSRERCDAVGLITRQVDLAQGDFGDLPTDFDYLLHFAVFQQQGLDYDHALRVNAEGTGRLMSHCRSARAALVMSTCAVYACHDDPEHVFHESDPLGDSHQPYSPTYAISKIAQEAVARFAAREFALPTTIARMNASYSGNGGLPAYNLDAILQDQPIVLPPGGRAMFSPIHQDDINAQVPALLAAAGTPATIVNWGGDEAVDMAEWCRYLGELVGKTPQFVESGASIPSRLTDSARRMSFTGPCKVSWREGLREMARRRYPEQVSG